MPDPPLHALPDADLLSLAQQGDLDAFTTLYHRHRDFVFRLALRFAQDHAAALDVSQDTFAYLLRKLPNLTLSGKLSTYLYPVVKNIALTRRRRLAGPVLPPRGDDLPHPESAAPPTDAEPDAALRAALDRLPDTHREVLLMRIVDEMSVDEVALALDIPTGTVKSRLHHALAGLRKELGRLSEPGASSP